MQALFEFSLRESAMAFSVVGCFRRHLSFGILAAAVGAVTFSSESLSQAYPARPVRILVGSLPGGVSDLAARIVSPYLTNSLGQSFIVENKPGGTGVIAATAAKSATPDGYTLLMANAADMTVNPAVAGKLPYDALTDFAHVIAVSNTALTLAVHPSLPVQNLKELIGLAKERAGSLAYASAGSGTVNHVVGEWFKSVAGVQMIHVPYKGGGPSTQDVIAGVVPVGVIAVSAAVPQERSGRLRVLGVSSPQRLQFKPDWPTVAESGFPGFRASVWTALVAPASTPPDVVARLNSEMNRVLNIPEVRERFNSQGAETIGGEPNRLTMIIRSDLELYADLVRKLNITRP
jgi:tripartite-type tricarboxylate transporter receptor subunit TctC